MAKKSKKVTIPRTYKSGPNAHTTHAIYATQEEIDLLRDVDLHNSGIGTENHYGPGGLLNMDGGDDLSLVYGGSTPSWIQDNILDEAGCECGGSIDNPGGAGGYVVNCADCGGDDVVGCTDPLVTTWLSNETVLNVHCCQIYSSGEVPGPSCLATWEQLGGDPNFNPHECCPHPVSAQPTIDQPIRERFQKLAGIKNKK